MINENNESHVECTLSDTDLFTPTFIQSDIIHGQFEDLFPITKPEDSGPIEFVIGNSTDKLIDPVNTFLKMKLSILKDDGTKIVHTDNVAPIN